MISRFVRLVAALLALAVFTAACGGGSDSGATSSGGDTEAVDTSSTDTTDDEPADSGSDDEADAADEPEESTDTVELIEVDESEAAVFGGTLRYALEADVDGLNPVSSAFSAPGLLMGVAVFDTLAVFDANDQWQPYLAESFTPNDDFTVWTMELREGVTFHDGAPLDGAAIAVNFGTVLQDPLVGLAVRPFYNLENPIEIIDELTVQYNLSLPNANWPTSQTGQLGMVASPAWLEAALADPTLNQAPIGTGPFVFESRSEDSVTRMVRNESWWNGDVYLDAVEFVPVTDPDTRNDLLLQGDIQALQTTNAASVDDLQNAEGIQNLIDDSGDESFIMINSTATPFDDIRARQALTYATPRQNYIDLIGLGIQQAADQMFTPSSPYYNPDGKCYEFDLEKAQALLDEAGYGEGFTITMNQSSANLPSMELIAEMWAEIGVTVEISLDADFPDWIAKTVGEDTQYDATWTTLWNWGDPVIGVNRSYNCDNRVAGVPFSNMSWHE